MSLEREFRSTMAVEHLREIGVKAVVFDLDDTLIYTSEIFSAKMERYAAAVTEALGRSDGEEIFEALKVINDEAYKNHGVRPDRWMGVAERLAETIGDESGVCVEMVNTLMEIYTTEPRIRPGVEEALDELIKGGIKVAIVTHASDEWTEFKLKTTGLDKYFETVVTASVYGSKTPEHWQTALDLLGVEGNEAVGIGDNRVGDVMAAKSLGMKCIWIPSPWAVFREGDLPDGVVEIDNTDQLMEGLMALR